MGVIKAAIILGAGGYAINKLRKSRHEEGHSCGCRHRNQSRDRSQPQDSQNHHAPQGTWTPGTKMRGPPELAKLPGYEDEKALGYQTHEFGNEKNEWVGVSPSEK